MKKGGEIIGKLKAKQEKFLIALLSEPTVVKACETAGITRKTGYKWLNDENFRSEYHKQRQETMKTTTGLLQQASGTAVKVLFNISIDDKKPAIARVQAAKTILEYAYKGVELEDIERRLESLETQSEQD